MRCNVMYGLFILEVVIALTPAQLSIQAQSNDSWARFQFLLGKWAGAGSGKAGEIVSGSTSFSFDLNKKIIIRKSRAEYAPDPGEKSGLVHEDMMVIYQQPGNSKFRAIYFDNEGNVINYAISFPAKQPSAIFESEASDKALRFRLAYDLDPNGALSIEFSVARPGGEFKIYTKGIVKRTAQEQSES